MTNRENLTLWAVILVLFVGLLVYPHIVSQPTVQAQLAESTLAEALDMAQTAYAQNNNRNAYITFDDGQILHIGDITEIGVDFLCFLVQPPFLPSNITPSPASRVDRCFPTTRIVQVDLSYRVPR